MDFDNPESRIEAILQNMLGANNVLDPPESRIEYLLQQILENGGGGGGQSAIHVKGVTTTALTDGCDTNPITINGESYTAVDGDLVAYQSKEFLFNGTIWQELGDVSEVMTIIEDILEDIAQEFDATASYAVDDYVLKDGVLYKCTTAHTGAWDANDFTATTISDEVADVANDIAGIKDGAEIDSFSDVETALAGKQGTLTAGTYIQIDGDAISVKRDISAEVDELFTATQNGNKLDVTLSVDGTIIESESFTQSGGTFLDLVTIGFNVRAVRWYVHYLKASKTHSAGVDEYIQTSTYSDTFVGIIGEDYKLITKGELDTALATKQDTLSFDNDPTANSNNPVKSGGIYTALEDKADNDIVAAEFDATATYAIGDYCIYEGGLYQFKAYHTGAWASADVDAVIVMDEISDLDAAKQPKTDNNLTTADKTTTGAINELKSGLTTLGLTVQNCKLCAVYNN